MLDYFHQKINKEFLKEKNVRTMIDEVLSKMEIETDNRVFEKNNGIARMFDETDTDGVTKMVIDHFLRRSSKIPKPQMSMHYPTTYPPNKKFVPRRSFGLPAFYVHYAAPEESTVSAMSRIPEEYHPGLDFIDQEADIFIADHGVTFAWLGEFKAEESDERISENFSTNPHATQESNSMTVLKWNPKKILQEKQKQLFEKEKKRDDDTTEMVFHGHGFHLDEDNGNLVDENDGYYITHYLNNKEMSDELSIQKIAYMSISEKDGSEEMEVLVLFEQHFMAAGRLKIKANCPANENIFYLDLVEVVGSYGTTDFEWSPGFKTVLRICAYKPYTVPEQVEGFEELKENIHPDILQIMDAVQKGNYGIAEANKNPKILHTGPEGTGSIHLNRICDGLSLALLVFKTYRESPNLDEYNFPTSRERLHYAYYKLEESHKNKCRRVGKCDHIATFLNVCRLFLNEFMRIPRLNAMEIEIIGQFRQTLCALYTFFQNPDYTIDKKVLKIMKCILNPAKIYDLDARFTYKSYLHFPRFMRPMILDILCQNELPSNHHYIHRIYSIDDKKSPNSCQEDVLGAMKQHPHVILFSTNPNMPHIRLMDELGQYYEENLEKEVSEPLGVQYLGPLGTEYVELGAIKEMRANGSRNQNLVEEERVEEPRSRLGSHENPIELDDVELEEDGRPAPVSTEPSTSEPAPSKKRAATSSSSLEPIPTKARRMEEGYQSVEDFEHEETSDHGDLSGEPSGAATMELEEHHEHTPSPPQVTTEPSTPTQLHREDSAEGPTTPITPKTSKAAKTPHTPSYNDITPYKHRIPEPSPHSKKASKTFNRIYNFEHEEDQQELISAYANGPAQPIEKGPECMSPSDRTRSSNPVNIIKNNRGAF